MGDQDFLGIVLLLGTILLPDQEIGERATQEQDRGEDLTSGRLEDEDTGIGDDQWEEFEQRASWNETLLPLQIRDPVPTRPEDSNTGIGDSDDEWEVYERQAIQGETLHPRLNRDPTPKEGRPTLTSPTSSNRATLVQGAFNEGCLAAVRPLDGSTANVARPVLIEGELRTTTPAELRLVIPEQAQAPGSNKGSSLPRAGIKSATKGKDTGIATVSRHTAVEKGNAVEKEPSANSEQPFRSRGLFNVGSTCFLNAALQCLVVIREFGETKTHSGTEGEIRSSLIECITQMRKGIVPSYTPMPLLKAIPKLTTQCQLGKQADAHELLLYLIGRMDQGGLQEVFD